MVNTIIQKLASFYQKHYSVVIHPKAIYFIDDTLFIYHQNHTNLPLHINKLYQQELKLLMEWATGRQVRAIYNDILNKTDERLDIFVFNPEQYFSTGPNYVPAEEEYWWDEEIYLD